MASEEVEGKAIDAGYLQALSNAVAVAADRIMDKGEFDAEQPFRNAWVNAMTARNLARRVLGLPMKE